MSLEEKLHKELDWLEIKHIDADGIIRNILSICQQEIDEACKKQRESDAEIFKGYCALGRGELFAYEDDFNIYCKILANAPTPKESK